MQTTLSYFHTTFSSYLRGHLQRHSTVPPRPSASETGSIGMRNIGSHLQQTLWRPEEPHPCSDSKDYLSVRAQLLPAHLPTCLILWSHTKSVKCLPGISAAIIRKEVFSSHRDYKCKCLPQFNYLPNCFLYL